MSHKKVEKLLYSYKKLNAEVKNISIEIEEIQNTYMGTKSVDPSKESTSKTNKLTSVVENEILNKEQRIQYLESIKLSKENQIRRIDNALEMLSERDRELIKLRFFEEIPNYQVANRMDLTEEACSMRKRKIIENIKNVLILD